MVAMSSRRVSRARVTRRLHATRAAGRPLPSKEAMETGSVLVVDDDPKILELVRAYLQLAGFAVVTAVDGEDALRKIEAHRDRKSTRLNSSHVEISYAVFCLKKKKREPDIR